MTPRAPGAEGGGEITTRDMIVDRRRVLQEQAEPLRSRLAAIDRELWEIDVVLSAMDAATGFSGSPEQDTIQEGILRTLSEAPAGLHLMDILTRMRVARPTLTRESLSPQISRLKRVDKVRSLSRAVWALAATPPAGFAARAGTAETPPP